MKFCRLLASIALALPLCVNAQNYPLPGVDQSAPVSGDTFYGPFPKEIPDGKTPDGKADEEQPFDLFECLEGVSEIFDRAYDVPRDAKGHVTDEYSKGMAAGSEASDRCFGEADRRGGQNSGSDGYDGVYPSPRPTPVPSNQPPGQAEPRSPRDIYQDALIATMEGEPPPSSPNAPYEGPTPYPLPTPVDRPFRAPDEVEALLERGQKSAKYVPNDYEIRSREEGFIEDALPGILVSLGISYGIGGSLSTASDVDTITGTNNFRDQENEIRAFSRQEGSWETCYGNDCGFSRYGRRVSQSCENAAVEWGLYQTRVVPSNCEQEFRHSPYSSYYCDSMKVAVARKEAECRYTLKNRQSKKCQLYRLPAKCR